MSRGNGNGFFGEDVVATALRLMCDHGLDGHTIQLVVYLDADKFHVSEFRCAACANRLPFLLVNSARQSVELRDLLLALGLNVNVIREKLQHRNTNQKVGEWLGKHRILEYPSSRSTSPRR